MNLFILAVSFNDSEMFCFYKCPTNRLSKWLSSTRTAVWKLQNWKFCFDLRFKKIRIRSFCRNLWKVLGKNIQMKWPVFLNRYYKQWKYRFCTTLFMLGWNISISISVHQLQYDGHPPRYIWYHVTRSLWWQIWYRHHEFVWEIKIELIFISRDRVMLCGSVRGYD